MSEYDATDGAIALAEENDIDLSEVEGTGADGKITKADVSAVIGDIDGDGGDYYCPGCGAKFDGPGTCDGSQNEYGHQPIEVTNEVDAPAPETGGAVV